MANKFYGSVGYMKTIEKKPGVWVEDVIERQYYGDVLSSTNRWEGGEHMNDNLNVSNRFSIVADPYAYENFQSIRYIVWNGVKWKINSVELAEPRLVLNIGGIYNGEQGGT